MGFSPGFHPDCAALAGRALSLCVLSFLGGPRGQRACVHVRGGGRGCGEWGGGRDVGVGGGPLTTSHFLLLLQLQPLPRPGYSRYDIP